MRRRITDAWARLGSLTPAAGLAAARRASGAFPATRDADPSDRSAGQPSERPAEQSSDRPAEQPSERPTKQPSASRNKLLVAGAGVLAALAVGGVIVAPKLLGGGGAASDPGCKAYSGTALTAYNKTIDDLNAQASQTVLTTDMSVTTTDLTSAISQAQSASVKSALTGLRTELQAVKDGVDSGSVPASTVSALNTASAKADHAC
jgi:hypothetical protein